MATKVSIPGTAGFTITGDNTDETLSGTAVTDVIYGMGGDDKLYGLGGNDTLDGGAGNDYLDGGTGVDAMKGGTGDDTYVVDSTGDTVSEASAAGTDTVLSYVTYTLSTYVENLTLVGTSTTNATGNTANNTLTGNNSSNILDGLGGADTLIGGNGNDTYFVDNTADTVIETNAELLQIDTVKSSVGFTVGENIENLTLLAGASNGIGNSLRNIIIGNASANVLDGKGGADVLTGGDGNDSYYVDNAGDTVTETNAALTQIDTVYSSVTYLLGANLENLSLIDGAGAINGTGNALVNSISGNQSNNLLDGKGGADTLIGWDGNDTYIVDNIGDLVIETNTSLSQIDTVQSSVSYTLGSNVEILTLLTGAGNINGTGNAQDNIINGNAGDNILDGGLGTNKLLGGSGSDTYIVNRTTDLVTELPGAGTDTVKSALPTYILGVNLENLILATGTANLNGTGNQQNNSLTGNAGNNTLDGGTGADTLIGGAGNDIFYVDNVGDTVTDRATDTGTDEVKSSVNISLAAAIADGVEKITLNPALTGVLANINATGNALDNTIIGNAGSNILSGGAGNDALTGAAGNDKLDGGTGADTLSGGLGDDNYIVDNVGDNVSENVSEGTKDAVQSSVANYTLTANVENLSLDPTLSGTAANINGTGNTLNNTITGNAGNNILDGGAGSDTLIGGAGNDTYVVDSSNVSISASGVASVNLSSGDTISETPIGTDSVQSSVNYGLSVNVENLTLTGSTAVYGFGNTLANSITGNSANNILNGGTGADTLVGGDGNDTFIVDNVNDIVTETNAATTQIDTVLSGVTFTLGANIENLTLTPSGSTSIGGTGNALANSLIGNNANNALDGAAGIDTLTGGGGADTLTGGLGADTFAYTLASDIGYGAGYRDVITDFSTAQTDKINISALDADPLTSGMQLWSFSRSASGGIPTFVGTSGEITFDSTNHLVQFDQNGDGAADFEIGLTGVSSLAITDFIGPTYQTIYGTSGNDSALTMTGWTGIDILIGKGGADTLVGGSGADKFTYTAASDTGPGATFRDIISDFSTAQGDKVDISMLDANLSTSGVQQWSYVRMFNNTTPVFTGSVGEVTFDPTNHLAQFDQDGNGVSDFEIQLNNIASLAMTDFIGPTTQKLIGTAGAETLTGWGGTDMIYGKAGADTLNGNGGNDTFVYTAASDTGLGAAHDTIIDFTSSSTDKIDVSKLDADTVIAGTQRWSLVQAGAAFSGLGSELKFDSTTHLLSFDQAGVGTAAASDFEILLNGVPSLGLIDLIGPTYLTIPGTNVADTLTGGLENNILYGKTGADSLTGGGGSDRFIYTASTDTGLGTGHDTITDFSTTLLDKIDISKLDADTATTGLQAWSFLGTGTTQAPVILASGGISFNSTTGILSFDQAGVGTNATADFEILLTGVSSLASTDFILS